MKYGEIKRSDFDGLPDNIKTAIGGDTFPREKWHSTLASWVKKKIDYHWPLHLLLTIGTSSLLTILSGDWERVDWFLLLVVGLCLAMLSFYVHGVFHDNSRNDVWDIY